MTEEQSEPGERPRLVLDEMHAPVIAHRLRASGHDVVSLAEDSSLRTMTDEEVYSWAAGERRRIVTENVKDFRRLLVRAQQTGGPLAMVLFTSSGVFPRGRRNPGPLTAALDAWLRAPDMSRPSDEEWLRPA